MFVPPRGVSPLAGAATSEVVELAHTGYVESFNITRVPIERRPDLKPPYCSAWIVLDGASVGFLGLVINIAPEEVRVGMRVRAVWKPDEELETSAANILGLGAHRRARRGDHRLRAHRPRRGESRMIDVREPWPG